MNLPISAAMRLKVFDEQRGGGFVVDRRGVGAAVSDGSSEDVSVGMECEAGKVLAGRR